MIIFALKLVLAHSIGDFLLQLSSWVKHKEDYKVRSKYLYAHIAVHLISLLVLLQFNLNYWVGIISIIVSHYVIDLAKIYLKGKYNKRLLFFTDQVLHLLVITIVVSAYTDVSIQFSAIYNPKFLLLITALIAVTSVASIVTGILISKWTPGDNEAASLDKAGSYIGMLERLFIFGFILANQWSGIGFLLAAKSVFRFGDLSNAKDRKLTEYILIGTFISFGLAVLIAKIYQFVAVKI